jgi:hypothetical protein
VVDTHRPGHHRPDRQSTALHTTDPGTARAEQPGTGDGNTITGRRLGPRRRQAVRLIRLVSGLMRGHRMSFRGYRQDPKVCDT